MDTNLDNQEDPLGVLSSTLSADLIAAVKDLYNGQLSNAKEEFDGLVQKLESELGSHQPLVDHLCLKLAKDLKGYRGLPDAVWLLNQRKTRSDTFPAYLNCILLTELTDEGDQKALDLAQEKAGEVPIRKLFCDVLLAEKQRCDRGKKTQSELDLIADLAKRTDQLAELERQDEELVFYLIQCFQRVAFLFRTLGEKELFQSYHKKAMELCERRKWDMATKMELGTHLIRALKASGKSNDVNIYVDDLLDLINEVIELPGEKLELYCGLKLVREAYNDVSVACSYHMLAEEKLMFTGKKLYESWRKKYGDEHHEVVFLASQLAYNFKSFDNHEEADRYLEVAEKGLKAFPETTKMIMQAKAKALIHVWKIYREDDDLTKAEFYCEEEIRVNRKHGISQQYVANALRNLAFIVRDQGRTEEGLKYLEEALDLSKQHRPDLTSFHEKVQNEIHKFGLETQ